MCLEDARCPAAFAGPAMSTIGEAEADELRPFEATSCDRAADASIAPGVPMVGEAVTAREVRLGRLGRSDASVSTIAAFAACERVGRPGGLLAAGLLVESAAWRTSSLGAVWPLVRAEP